MLNSSYIVLYGNQPNVLELRRYVLSSLGFRIFIADSAVGLDNLISTIPSSLLIVCYTVSAAERKRVSSLVAGFKRIPQLMFLNAGKQGSIGLMGESDFPMSAGPDAFRRAVMRRLQTQPFPRLEMATFSNGAALRD